MSATREDKAYYEGVARGLYARHRGRATGAIDA